MVPLVIEFVSPALHEGVNNCLMGVFAAVVAITSNKTQNLTTLICFHVTTQVLMCIVHLLSQAQM